MQDLAIGEAFEAAMNASKSSVSGHRQGQRGQQEVAAGLPFISGDDTTPVQDQGAAGLQIHELPAPSALVMASRTMADGAAGSDAAADAPGASSCLGDQQAEDDTCGVCLDAEVQVLALECGHGLCLACSREMARLHCLRPVPCPFCRSIISGFGALLPEKRS
jgi:hypothetical protein